MFCVAVTFTLSIPAKSIVRFSSFTVTKSASGLSRIRYKYAHMKKSACNNMKSEKGWRSVNTGRGAQLTLTKC